MPEIMSTHSELETTRRAKIRNSFSSLFFFFAEAYGEFAGPNEIMARCYNIDIPL
jgi:hypothetical protein